MKRNNLITAVLIAVMALAPIQLSHADPEPPKPDTWLAVCVVACAGIAVGAIYVFSKHCQPKYYWLMDNDQPPKFWVGTATKVECEINDWKRIGGPYNKPQDAPATHPDPTNRVSMVEGPVMSIAVEQTQDLSTWTRVYQETNTLDSFVYWPVMTNAASFRIVVTP